MAFPGPRRPKQKLNGLRLILPLKDFNTMMVKTHLSLTT